MLQTPRKPGCAAGSSEEKHTPQPGVPVLTTYSSNDIVIPADFLTGGDPLDARPITVNTIDWSKTPLPQHAGKYAVVLDNVLSRSECTAMLRLAEASASGTSNPWQPALVNIGRGYEVLHPNYRNSDRIIWDQQEVVDRLWARCLRAPGLWERLAVIENGGADASRPVGTGSKQRWEFRRLNQRMRFLKYQKGQFFRPHCDAPYVEPESEGKIRTHFTIHLYLNDSQAEAGKAADLVGGATSFLSMDETKKLPVDPKAGRVLIFQHKGLYHCGDDVLAGTKFTMRTDIMYELK